MKQDFTIWRNQILQNPQNISPLKFGMSQDEVIEIFGNPDAVSKAPHGLYLIYSDDEIELSMTAEHEERSNPYENI